MKRILCPELPTAERAVALPPAEAHHALHVFRLRSGDEVEVIDGRGGSVIARIRPTGGDTAKLEFSRAVDTAAAVVPIVGRLELAVLKGQSMEWAVEKAVELGVLELQPVLTAHTVVQIDRKGPEAFRERWQKIADQALKQCGRRVRMEVALPLDLSDLLTQRPATDASPRLWCDESRRSEIAGLLPWLENHREVSPSVLIGPEGGWSEAEKEMLSRSCLGISLGSLTLRAETAAIYVASLLAATRGT